MDETTYSDPAVIQLINENYVPVRIDRDLRPDIDARYNMGGWPTAAFLTPERDLLSGCTYAPPQEFAALLAATNGSIPAGQGEHQSPGSPVTGKRQSSYAARTGPGRTAT